MRSPLDGIRIVEIGDQQATRICGMILADLGAEVVSVVDTSHIGGNVRAFNTRCDRGKRSVVLALQDAEGASLLQKLVDRSDAVITGHPWQDLDASKSSGWQSALLRPGLVICAVTPFGAVGPWAEHLATDLTLQALSGVLSLTGHAEMPPVPNAFPIADFAGGLYAACAVLAGLVRAERSQAKSGVRVGIRIDISQLHCLVQLLGYTAQQYLLTGVTPGRVGSGHHSIAPYECYRCRDGWMVICAFTQNIWLRLVDGIGASHLAEDSRFLDLASRKLHNEALNLELSQRFETQTVDWWLTVLRRNEVPAAPVLDMGSALDSEFVRERGLVETVGTPEGSEFQTVVSPMMEGGARWSSVDPIPFPGEYNLVLTNSILRDG